MAVFFQQEVASRNKFQRLFWEKAKIVRGRIQHSENTLLHTLNLNIIRIEKDKTKNKDKLISVKPVFTCTVSIWWWYWNTKIHQLCYGLLHLAFCNILKMWSGGLHRGEPVHTLVTCLEWSSLLSVIRNAKSVAGLLGLFCNLLVPVAVISVLMPFGTNTVGPVRWKLKWNEITDWAVKGLFFMTTTTQLCPKKWMVSCA